MLDETAQTEKDRHHRYTQSNSPTLQLLLGNRRGNRRRLTQISAPYFGECAQAKLLLRRHTWEGSKDCLVRRNKLEMHIPCSAAVTKTTDDSIQVKVNVIH